MLTPRAAPAGLGRRLGVALLACLAASAGAAPHVRARQSAGAPAARKFDEIRIGGGSGTEERARLRRFAQQLRREPRARAYVIAYAPRVRNLRGSDHWSLPENRLLTTKAQLSGEYGLAEGRFVGVDGGVREHTTLELWVLPPGARPPEPRPHFGPADVVECCVLRVDGELYQYRKGEPLTFSARSSLGSCPLIKGYRWSVSAGRIAEGQGTETIRVDAREAPAGPLRATVEAEGLSHECVRAAWAATAVGVAPYRLAEFEENFSEALKIWGDHLAHYLAREPTMRGHIIVYDGRNSPRGHAAARAAYARRYLVEMRGVPAGRFDVVMGGYRERPMFEYWLVPEGAPAPPPAPWVDERYARARRPR